MLQPLAAAFPLLLRCRLFPQFASIRAVSARVSARVASFAVAEGFGTCPAGVRDGASLDEWAAYFSRSMWGAGVPIQSKL
jgi:hypothetical protein